MNDELIQDSKTQQPELELYPVSPDLARASYSDPEKWVFSEQLNFRNDSGYDMRTLWQRAAASIERAFGQNQGRLVDGRLTPDQYPVFKPGNKLRITVELVTDDN